VHTNPSNTSSKVRHAKLHHHNQDPEPTIRIIDKAADFAPGQDPIASLAQKNDELNHFCKFSIGEKSSYFDFRCGYIKRI